MVDDSKMDAETRPIDEVMNDTELGSLIMKYKLAIIAIVVISALTVAGLGLFSHNSNKHAQEASYKVYQLSQVSLTGLLVGKVDAQTFSKDFLKLNSETKSFKSLVPVAITATDYLISKDNNVEAKSILTALVAEHGNGMAGYFLRARLAVALENLNDVKGAIEQLEAIIGSKHKYLSAKLYTDLGRLYMQSGNKEKAKASFDYVVANFKRSEFYRVAQVYLGEMDI
ncbi:MAG: tetratricopeptide repeat protein [Bacteriovoracaceae bacterium]|nr:tetratricopeptide repeat protein [Bacteriovoracaceae bacterium]